MNNDKSSSLQKLSPAHRHRGGRRPEYRISVTLGVDEVGALWAAAAAKALSLPGMTIEDVLDVLGPREDPEIAECLAMLTAPAPVPGCTLEDFHVELVADAAPTFVETRRQGARRAAAIPFDGFAGDTIRSRRLALYDAEFGDAARRMAPVPKSRLN